MRFMYLLLKFATAEAMEQRLPALLASSGLALAHRGRTYALLANAPGDVLVLPSGRGTIIGKLFHRYGCPAQVKQISRDADEFVRMSGGRHLVERYWGSYIAVLERDDGSVSIMRDPLGGLPCYYASFDQGVAFASDGPLIIEAGLLRPSIDWPALGRALLLHHLPAEQTAIHGMRQVHPGSALSVRAADVLGSDPYWSPWDHVLCDSAASSPSHERLERVVRSSIAAWSSCFDRPLVGISGGLDSSIVAACLGKAGAALSCVTLITDDPGGDERRYSREVCSAIGAELLEMRYRDEEIDLDVSVASGVPVPCGKLHEQSYNRAVQRALAQCDGDAFFGGAGGDNVFYATHSARPLIDRLDAQGWSPRLIQTAKDIAAITGASLWHVAREAYRLTHSRQDRMEWLPVANYLSRDFVAAEVERPIEHPWLNPGAKLPLGKVGHVKLILRALNHLEHRDKSLPAAFISPLLSQPVVETCLGIPTWEWVEGGADRAVARRAFASALPSMIATRSAKGSPEGFVAQFIEARRPAIASRLLDGALASHGLLDRASLMTALKRPGKFGPGDCARIMSLLDTEAWVGHWSR